MVNFKVIHAKKIAKRLIRLKELCLIINPCSVTFELIKEENFKKQFDYFFWDENENLNLIYKKKYKLILIGNSKNDNLSTNDLQIINELRLKGYRIFSINSFFEAITGRIPLIKLKDYWVMNDDLFYLNNRWKHFFLKRFLDVFISILLLPIALSLVFIGVILTKLSSIGPVFFCQKRIGKDGKVFIIYKIRTMQHNPNGYKEFTVQNDTRVTKVGKLLRLTKIDELPQLYNILVGNMSLIGPRPEREDIANEMVKENPYYHLRHTIKPGVTGWAQVHNPKATPKENLEKLEYDLFYVKNQSVFLDLKIIIKTIKVILTFNSL